VSTALEGFNIKQGMIKEAQAMQQERIQQISGRQTIQPISWGVFLPGQNEPSVKICLLAKSSC
jgi:hypothetical protein